MSNSRIPLFPLELVLFPGRSLPLHIFEPRYREMTQDCLETKSPFAFHVGADLPLELACRQDLLELRSEAERQRRLVEHLTELYPQLERRERVRGKATGNGHGNL